MTRINNGKHWVSEFTGSERTIQRAYNFTVEFPESTNDSGNLQNRLDKLSESAGFPGFPGKYIEIYHVKKVNIEQYNYKREIQKLGIFPKSIPVLDHKGFELDIEFEEDSDGTIAFLIQWLQARILDEQGFYTSPNEMYIDPIKIKITNEAADLTATYSFKKCYFLKSSKPEYSYKNNQAISYTITFGSDYYEVDYANGSVPASNTKQAIKNSDSKRA